MEASCPSCSHGPLSRRPRGDKSCPSCGRFLFDEVDNSAKSEADDNELLASELREAFTFTGDLFHQRNTSSPEDSFERNRESAQTGTVIPRLMGDFEVLDEIGRGGMGIVFRARQSSLGREVALKLLPGLGFGSASSVRRFFAEARAAARLNHPSIVPVYCYGHVENHYYYAMALIDGCSLDKAIQSKSELLSSNALHGPSKEGGLVKSTTPSKEQELSKNVDKPRAHSSGRTASDYRYLAGLVADVAEGLGHAHSNGVIHRDIKPQNLLLSNQGRLYVTDFGLAHMSDDPHLTCTGELMGTPAYLSPEQVVADSKGVGHRTDIYSLGVTLYEILTHRRPYSGETRAQILSQICTSEPVPARRIDPRIPVDLETICLHAIDKDPARRYATASAMADDLRSFSQNKPISALRPGLPQRFLRSLRRRPGAAVLAVSLALTTIVAFGSATRVAASRAAEAERLLQSSYDQMVYADYRAPQLVADAIAQAEALGAGGPRLNLVRALYLLGVSNHQGAIDLLHHILEVEPDHIAALYLLAWAQWRLDDPAASRITFDRAEELGGATSADELFFRGLAAHRDRPEMAIESYTQANAVRAANHQFFPQAVLHLARAFNQRMYALRTDDVLASAESTLLQLIHQGYYEAYPYYLLSITYRLAGEIALARGGDGSQIASDEYFQAALNWARKGQIVNAKDDRPIMAEAECLERLGLFSEALQVRNRAIAAAGQSVRRCESYHYRWRLRYWLGDLEGALADIDEHRSCMPDSPFYKYVYPAWVHAECGESDLAAEASRAMGLAAPDDAQALVWSAAALRVLGLVDEADNLLSERAGSARYDRGLVPPQTEEWVRFLYGLALGVRQIDEGLALADASDQPRKLLGEAYFHASVRALGLEQRDEAKRLLEKAIESYDSEVRYTYHARTLWVMLDLDPQWPVWLTRAEILEDE